MRGRGINREYLLMMMIIVLLTLGFILVCRSLHPSTTPPISLFEVYRLTPVHIWSIPLYHKRKRNSMIEPPCLLLIDESIPPKVLKVLPWDGPCRRKIGRVTRKLVFVSVRKITTYLPDLTLQGGPCTSSPTTFELLLSVSWLQCRRGLSTKNYYFSPFFQNLKLLRTPSFTRS